MFYKFSILLLIGLLCTACADNLPTGGFEALSSLSDTQKEAPVAAQWAALSTSKRLSPFTLKKNQAVTFGSLKLLMQGDGNLVLFRGTQVLWAVYPKSQGDCSKGTCFAAFQSDGNFVLYNGTRAYWHTQTGGQPGNVLVLTDNFPFISLENGGSVRWAGMNAFAPFALKINETIQVNGLTLIMQWNGDLALYQGARLLWNANPSPLPNCASNKCAAVMQGDGNLVLYNGTTPYWNSGTGGVNSALLALNAAYPHIAIVSPSGAFVWEGMMKRTRQFNEKIGAAFADSRYNPFSGGDMSKIVEDGIQDAAGGLGFQTMKFFLYNGSLPMYDANGQMGMNSYRMPIDAPLKAVRTLRDMAQLRTIKTLFAPFKTIFLGIAAISYNQSSTPAWRNPKRTVDYWWNFSTTAMTQDDIADEYQQTYDLAGYLLSAYKGTHKTFILQNHEADNHIGTDLNSPTAIGLQNMKTFWLIRQRAIADARAAVASDVKLVHMCEVNRVMPSMYYNFPSAVRDVLPYVTCDLAGYSAYEAAVTSRNTFNLNQLGGGDFPLAIGYIETHSNLTGIMGPGQKVAISEIGVPENLLGLDYQANSSLAVRYALARPDVPYVIYWELYCNEPIVRGSFSAQSLSAGQVNGYWIRRPDGSLGNTFASFLPFLY